MFIHYFFVNSPAYISGACPVLRIPILTAKVYIFLQNALLSSHILIFSIALRQAKLDGDSSLMTYRGHSVLHTLIRCYFSPMHTTGQVGFQISTLPYTSVHSGSHWIAKLRSFQQWIIWQGP